MSDDRMNRDADPAPSDDASLEDVPSQGPGEVVTEVEVGRPGAAWQFPVILLSAAAIAAAIYLHRDRQEPEVDPTTHLAAARVALDRGSLDEAAGWLVQAEAHLSDHPELLSDYHLLVADHRARTVSPVHTAPSELAAQVADAYARAISDGADLDPRRRLVFAEALAASGEEPDALTRLDALVAELRIDDPFRGRAVALRQSLRRKAIETMVDRGEPANLVRRELAALLIEDVGVEVDAWAVGLDARLRLETGELGGLAHGLVFEMRRLEGRLADADDPMISVDWARLWVLLGHAYRDELMLHGRAMECYLVALNQLAAAGQVAVEASLALAGLEIAEARLELRPRQHAAALEAAFGHYEQAMSIPEAGLGERASAEIGMAQVELLRDDHRAALVHLADAAASMQVADLQGGSIAADAVRVAIEGAERAGAEVVRRTGVDAVELCDSVVEYADLVARFADDPRIRRRGLELIAEARERSAGLILLPHLGDDDPRLERAVAVVPVDVRLEVARRFAAAAAALDEVELDMAGDDPDRFLAIWKAATLHDKAGAVELSLTRYVRFVESQSAESSLWPEAVYRVAAAHHSMRSLGEAEEWYRRLLEGMAGTRDEVSEFTTRAKVGLARVLMEQGGESAIPEAESLLNGVLSGTARDAIEPSVPEYRHALLQLVRLLATSERWGEVAGRGEEWLQRYQDDPRWGEIAVRTGRAFLMHADEVGAMETGEFGNPSLGAARDAERLRSLALAGARLGEAVDRLGGRAVDGLDPLESRLLRAAYVDRAIVADRRGELGDAIRLHQETERRFAGEPVAIIALVMMADAAERAGDLRTAASATDRARKRLQHLHRQGRSFTAGIEDLGPELMFGPTDETLRRWISAFPPGLGVATGEEGSP